MNFNVPTIEQQAGWFRTYPEMICTSYKVLKKITQFNFDLSNDEFLSYVKCRLGFSLTEQNINTLTNPDAEKYFLTSHDLKIVEDESGKPIPPEKQIMVPLDSQRRNSLFQAHKISKARIQDCWEIFILGGKPALFVPGVDHAVQPAAHPEPEIDPEPEPVHELSTDENPVFHYIRINCLFLSMVQLTPVFLPCHADICKHVVSHLGRSPPFPKFSLFFPAVGVTKQ